MQIGIILLIVGALVAAPIFNYQEILTKFEMSERVIQFDKQRFCNVKILYPTVELLERQRNADLACNCFTRCGRYINSFKPLSGELFGLYENAYSLLDRLEDLIENCWNRYVSLHLAYKASKRNIQNLLSQ